MDATYRGCVSFKHVRVRNRSSPMRDGKTEIRTKYYDCVKEESFEITSYAVGN